jgi:hypothetical protein
MVDFKFICDVQKNLSAQVYKYLAKAHGLSKNDAIKMCENPSIIQERAEDRRRGWASNPSAPINEKEDILWFWVSVGNIAHYRFGFIYNNEKRGNTIYWDLIGIQKLNYHLTWEDWKKV